VDYLYDKDGDGTSETKGHAMKPTTTPASGTRRAVRFREQLYWLGLALVVIPGVANAPSWLLVPAWIFGAACLFVFLASFTRPRAKN
jgi:hypothetical protein